MSHCADYIRAAILLRVLFMFENVNIPAQLVGLCGTVLMFLSYQSNKRRLILCWQILASLFFTVHFAMLGAYTGAAMNLLGGIRTVIFIFREDHKWAQSKLWIFIFSAVFLAAGILTWKNPLSLLPTFAMVLSNVALWFTNPSYIRMVIFPCSPCWFVYNVFAGSYTGCLTEIIVSSSLIIAIIRFDLMPFIKRRRSKTV